MMREMEPRAAHKLVDICDSCCCCGGWPVHEIVPNDYPPRRRLACAPHCAFPPPAVVGGLLTSARLESIVRTWGLRLGCLRRAFERASVAADVPTASLHGNSLRRVLATEEGL